MKNESKREVARYWYFVNQIILLLKEIHEEKMYRLTHSELGEQKGSNLSKREEKLVKGLEKVLENCM